MGEKSYLNGIVKCAICGSPMGVTWINSGNKKTKLHYFKCRRQAEKGKVLCSKKMIRVEELEKAVNKILEITSSKEFINEMINKARRIQTQSIEPLELEQSTIMAQIKEKEKQIENLINNLKSVTSEFVVKQVEKEIKKISEEIGTHNHELIDIREKIKYCRNDFINKEYLIENYKAIPEAYKAASFEEKKLLLKTYNIIVKLL